MSILPRELASRYEVLSMMGEGGMGAVYKVRHNELDRICVIKVMQAQLQTNPQLRERFLGEARKGALVSHPNIATVLDFFVGSNGTACLVMEYVDGKNLADVLESEPEPLNYKTAADIIIQALDALACLHSKKLVHRDISPDNLMLTYDPAGHRVVKLIDLGIAKSLEPASGPGSTVFFVGKSAYAPPEQFGNQVDTRSDIYSMGVVLYKLLTKALPIVAKDFAAYYAAHLQNELPRSFSETDPQGRVPESIRRVVLKALQKTPEDRYQTAEEFRDALQQALIGSATTVRELHPSRVVVPGTAEERLRMKKKTTRVLMLVFGTLAAAVLGPATAWILTAVRHPSLPPSIAASSTATAGSTVEVTGSLAPPANSPGTILVPDRSGSSRAVTEGKRLADAGDMLGAHEAFDRATKADPSNAYAWANVGAAAVKLGRPDEAKTAYRRALLLDPNNWLAHYNLGCVYARTGERDEAFNQLERAIAQLKAVRSRSDLESLFAKIKNDDALRILRNDERFVSLLSQ
jgi:serine/threonine protein kinase